MESIRIAMEQASGKLTEHPDMAVATDAAATAVREDGLRFRVEGPNGALTSDMSKSVGGDASAPTPGWLLRASLAACDATLVAMEAARDGIELTDLTVSVESESDFRGVLGVDDSVHPGPLAVRVRVELAAPDATEDQLREIVRRAEAHSPVRDALVREVSMTTEVMTGRSETEAPALGA
ncbi:MAG: OsmC family protein [Solirubrobacterales bacterium]